MSYATNIEHDSECPDCAHLERQLDKERGRNQAEQAKLMQVNAELLEALKKAQSLFDESNKNYPDWMPTKELNEAFDLIRYAIKKA